MRADERAQETKAAIDRAWKGNPLSFERGGLTLVLDAPAQLIRSRSDEVVGADAMVRLFDARGEELRIDPHRRIVNPPQLVVTGRGAPVDLGGGFSYRPRVVEFDPLAAFVEALWGSIERAPNPRAWRTRGTVTTFFGDTDDGWVRCNHGTYATARSGAGTLVVDVTNPLVCGQTEFFGYYCSLTYVGFDTAAIPDGDPILAVTLSLDGNADFSTVNFTARVRTLSWGASLTSADYIAGASFESTGTLVATWSSAGYSAGYNAFTSEAAFLSAVNVTGMTELVIGSDRFANGDVPGSGTSEYVQWESADASGTTTDPKLDVTHGSGGAIPAIMRDYRSRRVG